PQPPRFTLFPYTTLFRSQEVKNDETSHLFSQLRCAPDVLFSDECTGPAASPKCDRSLDEEHSRRRTARHHAGWRNWRSVESAQIDRKSTRLNSSHVAISY